MDEDPRPNSPEDVGFTLSAERERFFEGARMPAYIERIQNFDRQCRGPRCRVLIRWAVTISGAAIPLERRPGAACDFWEAHHAYCPDAESFRKEHR